MHTFKVGDRIKLLGPVDRYPDFVAPSGLTGTISQIDEHGNVSAKMDQHIAGCEEWDNEIWWDESYIDDINEDLALIG